MDRVYIVSYKYLETYFSPDPEEHETVERVLLCTLDESLANKTCDDYNKDGVRNRASIKSYELK